MKNLYEGILDIEDNIKKGTSDQTRAHAALNWLKDHEVDITFRMRYIIDNWVVGDEFDIDSMEWRLTTGSEWSPRTLVLDKNDDHVPDFIQIHDIDEVTLTGYRGDKFPDLGLQSVDCIIIRNCPNLKSLANIPKEVGRLIISGCPKLKSLDDAPDRVSKYCKVINNGFVSDKNMLVKRFHLNKRMKDIYYDKSN